ncbi:MAG TPA: alpha-glucosidase/alpha-galactosidase [Candidatus Caccousia avistercoris]|nr:alpha-glucosidase/alpha-galactosidase [Candidatus Caccousia avistercoris]
MRKPKIVFIGAGSMSFGVPTFRDIFTTEKLRGATLWLVDIDPENLERMYGLALKMNEVSGLALHIEKTENRREALPGADFVINSLAIERCDLWKHDFQVPKKYGIRHCLGENGGPGALYFTMRTLPLILEITKDMEELCPNAWFLNFSNPETRIVLGVNMFTRIKCVGLCHGIFMAQHDIAEILGREPGDIQVFGAGMNHFQWILSIRDKNTNEDLYPEFRRKEAEFDPAFRPYSRKMFHFFGLYPTCSDDHLGEYQAYGYEAGEHGYDFEWDAQERVRMKQEIAEVMAGTRDVREWLHPSGEQAIELLTAIYFNERKCIPSAIVYNGGAISQLPPDVAVEIPIVADGDGVHKTVVENLPDGIVGLLNMQVSPQRLSVRAAVNGSKDLALQALLCDPVINSTQAAVQINDELFEINRKYIKKVL